MVMGLFQVSLVLIYLVFVVDQCCSDWSPNPSSSDLNPLLTSDTQARHCLVAPSEAPRRSGRKSKPDWF